MSYLNRFDKNAVSDLSGESGMSESKQVDKSEIRLDLDNFTSDAAGLFPVPPPPELAKVSEPKPVKRLAPGYDMRTLRKQVDQLHQDILERVENQGLLYSQNKKLWTYMRDLLENNKINALKVRHQMSLLHNELHELHMQRAQLAEKLRAGQALKADLYDSRDEHSRVEAMLKVADGKQILAYETLERAQDQNKQLESTLQAQVERMHTVHSQLDQLRLMKREEDALDLADEHYSSCRSTLRSAMHRFQDNIQRRIRLRAIHKALQRMYHTLLLRMTLGLWREHRHRVGIAKRNCVKRAIETMHLCWARWKVHAALERHFRNCTRRRQLSIAMRYLKEGVRISQLEKVASSFRAAQLSKECLRNAFKGWRNQCMFLLWDSPITDRKEVTAIRHNMKRVLLHWRKAAVVEKMELMWKAQGATGVAGGTKRVFNAWRALFCVIRVHRDRSKQRVFIKLQLLMSKREFENKQLRKVVAASWRIRQRGCLHRLMRIASRKRKILCNPAAVATMPPITFPRSNGTARSAIGHSGVNGRHRNSGAVTVDKKPQGARIKLNEIVVTAVSTRRKKIFKSLLTWAHRTTKWKRLEISRRLAAIHHAKRARRRFLHIWHFNTCQLKRNQEVEAHRLKRIVFDAWCIFVPYEKRLRHLEDITSRKYEAVLKDRQRQAIRVWFKHTQRNRRLKIMEYQMLRRLRVSLMRCRFSSWRSAWGSHMLWKEKEAKIAAKRSMALVDLRSKEIEDLVIEQNRLRDSYNDATSALDRMNDAVQRKEKELEMYTTQLQEREAIIEDVQQQLKVAKESLEDCMAERNRLRVLEEVFDRDREFENERQMSAKAAAQRTLRQLEDETRELKKEVEDAKKMSLSTKQSYEYELATEEKYLENTVAAASTLHSMVQEKTQEIGAMEQERDSLLNAISMVKQKLEATAGNVLSGESNRAKELRSMRAEVDELRSSTLETESRVEAIREAIRTRQQRVREKQMAESFRNHSREFQEMNDITFNMSRENFANAYPVHPSPSALPLPPFSATKTKHNNHSDINMYGHQNSVDPSMGGEDMQNSPDEGADVMFDGSSIHSGEISSVRSVYLPPSPLPPMRSESPHSVQTHSRGKENLRQSEIQRFSSYGSEYGEHSRVGRLPHSAGDVRALTGQSAPVISTTRTERDVSLSSSLGIRQAWRADSGTVGDTSSVKARLSKLLHNSDDTDSM